MNDKNRETQLTAEFADLIQMLEKPGAKPYAPTLAQEEKMKLRRQLLTQGERPFLSRKAVGNLWQFAGTAVFLAVIIIVGVYFWGIFSRSGQAGPGPTTEPQPTATSEPTVAPTAVVNLAVEGIQFGDELVLTNTEIVPMPDGLGVALDWFVAAEPEQDYRVFFHLLDDQGELVAQLEPLAITLRNADSPSEFTSTWTAGEGVRQIYSLPYRYPSSRIANGQYDLVMGLYDVRTGERLPVTAVDESQIFDDGTAVFLGNWAFGSGPFNDDTYIQVVNTEGLGLTVRAAPGGMPLAMIAEGEILTVLDGPTDVNGQLWWRVRLSDTDGTEGWVMDDFVEPVAAPE